MVIYSDSHRDRDSEPGGGVGAGGSSHETVLEDRRRRQQEEQKQHEAQLEAARREAFQERMALQAKARAGVLGGSALALEDARPPADARPSRTPARSEEPPPPHVGTPAGPTPDTPGKGWCTGAGGRVGGLLGQSDSRTRCARAPHP
jgi:hypothetical protein